MCPVDNALRTGGGERMRYGGAIVVSLMLSSIAMDCKPFDGVPLSSYMSYPMGFVGPMVVHENAVTVPLQRRYPLAAHAECRPASCGTKASTSKHKALTLFS